MSETEKRSVRLTRRQIEAVLRHGEGDLSRGLRKLISQHLKCGPIDLPRGLAKSSPQVRAQVCAARWPVQTGKVVQK